MAKAEVEVVVKGQQVDQLKGKLVELQKGLKIQYDISGKPIDIVIDKSINLQKQLRLLTQELRKTKEGTAEFQLLSSKIGDTEDALARSNAKSRDLLGSLQLIPGPVGQIASQLNGAISALKLFTGFSFKDIRFQLKELNDDLNGIIQNIFGVKGAAVEASAELADTASTLANTGAEQTNTAATLENAAAQQASTVARLENVATTDAQTAALMANGGMLSRQADGSFKVITAQQNMTAAIGQTTVATETQTVATNTASTATKGFGATLKGVLSSTLFWVAAIGTLVYALYQWLTSTKKLTAEQEALKNVNEETIKQSGDLISKFDLLSKRIKQGGLTTREKNEITNEYNKTLGDTLGKVKSYEELERKVIANGPKYVQYLQTKAKADAAYALVVETNKQIIQKGLEDPSSIASFYDVWSRGGILGFFIEGREGTGQEMQKDAIKRLNDYKNQLSGIFETTNKEAQALADELKIPVPKIEGDTKGGTPKEDPRIQTTKDLYKRLKDLQTQNEDELIRTSVAKEREKEFELLRVAKEREENEIKALKLTDTKIDGVLVKGEDLRAKMLQQIQEKYAYKVLQNKEKYAKEDLDKLKQYQDKAAEIMIEGMDKEEERKSAKREKDKAKELQDLEQQFEDEKGIIERSETEKEELRAAIRKKYAREEEDERKEKEKKEKDERLQKLDDEIQFLENRQAAIREGTKAYFDSQREILDAAEKREIEALDKSALSKEEYEKKKTAIEEKYSKLRKDLKQQELQADAKVVTETLDALANLTSALASSYDEEAKTSKEAFQKRKNLQIATATMSAASGIIQILTQPSTLPSPFDWIVKGINAAALAVTTAVQISNIKKTQFEGGGGGAGTVRGMARGGYIDGPRHAQGGVMIEAEGGEAVMTRGAVSMFGPMLSLMNQAGGGTNFSRDMMFTANDQPQSSATGQGEPMILKTYVVSNELTSEQEKQARLKQLSTL